MANIFWDFDGTIVEGGPLWRRVLIRSLDDLSPGHGIQLDDLKESMSSGFPWHSSEPHELKTSELWWMHMERKFSGDLTGLGFEKELAGQVAKSVRSKILDPEAYKLVEGVESVLKKLSDKGWVHLVLSNNHPDLSLLLERLGIRNLFSDVITSAEVGYEKPRAEIFQYALKCANAESHSSWMIGDSMEADIRGASSTGTRTILVGHHPEARNLFEIEDIVGQV